MNYIVKIIDPLMTSLYSVTKLILENNWNILVYVKNNSINESIHEMNIPVVLNDTDMIFFQKNKFIYLYNLESVYFILISDEKDEFKTKIRNNKLNSIL